MKIVIGSDHAGYRLKERIKEHLEKKRNLAADIIDAGPSTGKKSVDYPDYAKKVAEIVKKNRNAMGILICGTGTGMCIAANRLKGIRAIVAYDGYSARMSRHDNDANILCLRGRKTDFDKELKIVDVWLRSGFSGMPRHKRRIKKLDRIKV